jgi:hypothetical protein
MAFLIHNVCGYLWRGFPERSEKQAVDISYTVWFALAVNIFSMTNRYNPYSKFIILY